MNVWISAMLMNRILKTLGYITTDEVLVPPQVAPTIAKNINVPKEYILQLMDKYARFYNGFKKKYDCVRILIGMAVEKIIEDVDSIEDADIDRIAFNLLSITEGLNKVRDDPELYLLLNEVLRAYLFQVGFALESSASTLKILYAIHPRSRATKDLEKLYDAFDVLMTFSLQNVISYLESPEDYIAEMNEFREKHRNFAENELRLVTTAIILIDALNEAIKRELSGEIYGRQGIRIINKIRDVATELSLVQLAISANLGISEPLTMPNFNSNNNPRGLFF